MRPSTALIALFLLAGSLRFACVSLLHEQPYGDYASYLIMASNLYDGKGLLDEFDNQAFMNSGYPFFLYAIFLLTGKSIAVATYANAVLGTISVLLIYLLGKAVLSSRNAAFIGALVWAIYFPAITYCAHLAKENLMIPLLLAQLLLLVTYLSKKTSSLAPAALGILIGFGSLVGSALLAVAPVFAMGILVANKSAAQKIRGLVVLTLCAVVTVSPWLYRNYQIFGAPLLNTNGGFNLYLGNNPAATGMFVSVADTPLGPEWEQLRLTAGEAGAGRKAQNLAIGYIKEHPKETLLLAVKKLGLFWYPPVHQGLDGDRSKMETLARKIWLMQYSIIFPLAVISFIFWLSPRHRSRYPHLWVLYSSVALYAALHMAFYIIFRYRLPIMPIVVLLAAHGGWLVLEWWINYRKADTARGAMEQKANL